MNQVDVIVIGAGIAGLTAARELTAARKSALVLEARDRVGGRTEGHTLNNGFVVEMGGQWVGPAQTEVLRLIAELGLETAPTYETGTAITLWDGQVIRWPTESGTLGLPDVSLPEFARVAEELETLAYTVPLEAPWTAPDAEEFDRQTLDNWLRTNTDDSDVYALMKSIVDALVTAEPWKMSLLHFLFYLKSNRMLENMVSFGGGNQAERIVGGSHLISERMAHELGDGVLRLKAPVRAIEQTAGGATVTFDGGECYAERVIIAIPPTLAGRLDYRPALPVMRDKLTQQYPMGSVVKVQVAYEEPFWRSDGLSGFTDSLDEPLFFTIDSSPADASCGVLAGLFIASGARMIERMSPHERKNLVLDCLASTIGPRSAEPVDYAEKVWSAEEYTRGCYGGHLGAGVWMQYGEALTKPVGRIHWAGTETADISNGYMDGAVRSGKRAAAEVLSALSATAPSETAVAAGND